MTTIRYTENVNIIAGLQADTRDHKALETEIAKERVFDILINAISSLPVTHCKVIDRQVYYNPTITRKAAYHGAFLKSFYLFSGFDIMIGGSLDHQYPLEVFLSYSGLIVKKLYTFKSSSRALTNNLLPEANKLAECLANKLNQTNFDDIAEKIEASNYLNCILQGAIKLPYHWRHYKKACIKLMETIGI